MFRILIPTAAAVLLFASAKSAQAQPYATPGSALPPGLGSFYWYGVPNGSLQRTLNNGNSIYPYYYFGGYRSVYRMPSSESGYVPYSNNETQYRSGILGWRRGWRR